MSLAEYNEVILEWLMHSKEHEDTALRFWGELGHPKGVDTIALQRIVDIKAAMSNKEFARALELLNEFTSGTPDELKKHGVQPAHVPDAKFRLAIGELEVMIKNETEPLKVIAYARESVAPLIKQIESVSVRADYTKLLNWCVSLLVLPKQAATNAVLDGLYDEKHRSDWIFEALYIVRDDRVEESRLHRTALCLDIVSNAT